MGAHGSELLCGNLEDSSTVHFHHALRKFFLSCSFGEQVSVDVAEHGSRVRC